LAHEVFIEIGPAFDDDAAELMAERERPGQRLWPMPFQDMQIRAADAAGADLDKRGFPADLRPRHGANDRLRAGAVIGANPNFLHANLLHLRVPSGSVQKFSSTTLG